MFNTLLLRLHAEEQSWITCKLTARLYTILSNFKTPECLYRLQDLYMASFGRRYIGTIIIYEHVLLEQTEQHPIVSLEMKNCVANAREGNRISFYIIV